MWPVIMTDSFTHCWRSARLSLPALWLALACWLLAPVLAQAQVADAEITQMEVERTDEGVFLSAQVQFALSAAVEDALAKGVPVHFIAQAQLTRNRWYWYDKKITTATRRMRLTYQPLTRHWKLSLTQGADTRAGIVLNQSFDSLNDALQALSRLSRWKIAESAEVDPESHHSVAFSFRLDSSELPRPLQIGILGQSDWTLAASRTQSVVVGPAK